jgi:hypothetical protein
MMNYTEIMKNLKKAMIASDLKSSMRAFKDLCSLKSDEYAVDKWNCLHMEIHPRWPQNVAMGE